MDVEDTVHMYILLKPWKFTPALTNVPLTQLQIYSISVFIFHSRVRYFLRINIILFYETGLFFILLDRLMKIG